MAPFLLLLLLLLPVPPCLSAVTCTNTSAECGAALQLQDTVSSRLRSESNEKTLRELVADHKTAWQELRNAVDKTADEQRSSAADLKHSMEMAAAGQKHSMEVAAAEQKLRAAEQMHSMEMATAEQKNAALRATWEMRIYLGFTFALVSSAASFLFCAPARAIAMLRAYIGPHGAP